MAGGGEKSESSITDCDALTHCTEGGEKKKTKDEVTPRASLM